MLVGTDVCVRMVFFVWEETGVHVCVRMMFVWEETGVHVCVRMMFVWEETGVHGILLTTLSLVIMQFIVSAHY